MTFRPLPFQFQQRGAQLSEKLQDPRTFAQFIEQRDQDLENYLAGLTGGLTSVALWGGTELTGGGTTLTTDVTATVDLSFQTALGPKFDVATGKWTGPDDAFLIVGTSVRFVTSGLGFAVLTPAGSALEGGTSLTLVGSEVSVTNAWKLGGTYTMRGADYNAFVDTSPESILGEFTLQVLGPGTTFVDATLMEPATLTVDMDGSSAPPTVFAVG